MTAPDLMPLPGAKPFSAELAHRLGRALASQPEGYRPRTRHLHPDGRPKWVNRLIESVSPYLLQHAHNPVNWRPWSEEAFAAARDEDRPILLSVGYATCHWCHVMEHESFEDPEIAELINRNFVAIKVDREERPDVDDVYMTAVQLVRGGGGWPMTVFLTADGEPFFAGTYFPARDGDRGARIGFSTILDRLAATWREDREKVRAEASRLTSAVRSANRPQAPDGVPGESALVEAARFLGRIFDREWGGFGSAPKFPRPSTYELLLRYGLRSGDPGATEIVLSSLDQMSRGGIYDHLAGGFARYSTDREWLVPHFEKMLYDNAQLSTLLTEALQVSGRPTVETTLRETLDYVLAEMTHPGGGFFSATDADSEGEEGKYFVWTPEEIKDVLGPDDGEQFSRIYGVTEPGNFEGSNILHLPRPLVEVAAELGRTPESLGQELRGFRAQLHSRRAQRVPPLLDDKILTEWNAQMLGAFARAGFVLDEPRYLDAARRAAAFVLDELQEREGALLRAWRNGRTSGQAVLEDYAFFIAGLLDLFEATTEARWLTEAEKLQETMVERFWDADGGAFFGTDATGDQLLVRDKPSYDGAQPSGNSVAARVALRLHALTGEAIHLERADRVLLAFGQLLEGGAVQNPKLATALDWRLDRARQIVIVKGPGDKPLIDVLRRTFLPNAVRVVGRPETLQALVSRVPWLDGKVAREGQGTAYVCFEGACKAPTSDPETLRAQLAPEVRIQAPPLTLGRSRPTP
ncbi:MAG: thioredoxin domain-containing protein [Myxococcota bacterium]